jgi:hypothetical protein
VRAKVDAAYLGVQARTAKLSLRCYDPPEGGNAASKASAMPTSKSGVMTVNSQNDMERRGGVRRARLRFCVALASHSFDSREVTGLSLHDLAAATAVTSASRAFARLAHVSQVEGRARQLVRPTRLALGVFENSVPGAPWRARRLTEAARRSG